MDKTWTVAQRQEAQSYINGAETSCNRQSSGCAGSEVSLRTDTVNALIKLARHAMNFESAAALDAQIIRDKDARIAELEQMRDKTNAELEEDLYRWKANYYAVKAANANKGDMK